MVDESHKLDLQSKIDQLNQQIEEINNAKIDPEVEEAEKQLTTLKTTLESLNNEVKELEQNIITLSTQYEEVQTNESIPETSFLKEEISNLEASIEELKGESVLETHVIFEVERGDQETLKQKVAQVSSELTTSKTALENLQAENSKLLVKSEECSLQLNTLESEEESLKTYKSELGSKVGDETEKLNSRLIELRKEKIEQSSAFTLAENHLKSVYESHNKLVQELKEIEKKISIKNQQSEKIQNEIEEVEADKMLEEKELQALTSQLEDAIVGVQSLRPGFVVEMSNDPKQLSIVNEKVKSEISKVEAELEKANNEAHQIMQEEAARKQEANETEMKRAEMYSEIASLQDQIAELEREKTQVNISLSIVRDDNLFISRIFSNSS